MYCDALSLYKPIATFKFMYTAHFLCDALKPIAILSKNLPEERLVLFWGYPPFDSHYSDSWAHVGDKVRSHDEKNSEDHTLNTWDW